MKIRIQQIDEKGKSVKTALKQINVDQVERESGVPASMLQYDFE
jgi:hypothetical protein